MNINPSIIHSREMNILPPDELWRMYSPPRTLGATKDQQIAMDNQLASCGYAGMLSHVIGLGAGKDAFPQFLGYPLLAGLQQNPIIRSGVVTVADEMTKKWGEVTYSKESEKHIAIDAEMVRLDMRTVFNRAAQLSDFDGGCLVFIDTGETDLTIPLTEESIKYKKIKRLKVVEAINVYPGVYNSTDPLAENYFEPDTWLVLGRHIHSSRFLYFSPNTVPLIFKPSYNFFGIPAAQMALDYVTHFTKTRESAQRLLTKFSLTVFKSNMSGILQGGAAHQFDMRMKYLAQVRDNDMILACDKEMEDVIKLDTSLAGVTDVVTQAIEFVASIFRIPIVKFLGISPGGLNSTGESDMRSFYDHVASKQETILRKPLMRCVSLIQSSLFGEIDKELDFKFSPLNEEDTSVIETSQKLKAERLSILAGAGIIDEVDARRILEEDEKSGVVGF